MLPRVNIFISDGDPADAAFAALIQSRVGGFAEAIVVTPADLADDRVDPLQRRFGLAGTHIVVLSPALVQSAAACSLLQRAIKIITVEPLRYYVICRGVEPKRALEDQKELQFLFDNTTAVDAGALPTLVADLREYLTKILPKLGGSFPLVKLVAGLAQHLASTAAARILPLFTLAFMLGFLAPLAVAATFFWDGPSTLRMALSAWCAYCAGFAINELFALDFWPWAGSAWKLRQPLRSEDFSDLPIGNEAVGPLVTAATGLSAIIASHTEMVAIVAFGLAMGAVLQTGVDAMGRERARRGPGFAWPRAPVHSGLAVSGAAADPTTLSRAVGWCLSSRRWTVKATTMKLLWFLLPVGVVLWRAPLSAAIAAVAAFLFGLMVCPFLTRWKLALDSFLRRHTGLTERHIEALESRLARLDVKVPPEMSGVEDEKLIGFTEQERATARRWATMNALATISGCQRTWRAPRVRAFVSYAWTGDPGYQAAANLVATLQTCRVPCFLDRHEIASPFENWRTRVYHGVMHCTHLFLLISPNLMRAAIVRRELITVFQRWHLEQTPAVICVAPPALAESMRSDARVPLEVRFALAWCPVMSLEEARDPELVAALLEQRRRQGRFRDLTLALSPSTAREQLLASLIGQPSDLAAGSEG
ncbi:MAG: TIR domain-containing protein [Phycisphaerales bacterium]